MKRVGSRNSLPSKVKSRRKMPPKIHWTIPVKIRRRGDNPLGNTMSRPRRRGSEGGLGREIRAAVFRARTEALRVRGSDLIGISSLRGEIHKHAGNSSRNATRRILVSEASV